MGYEPTLIIRKKDLIKVIGRTKPGERSGIDDQLCWLDHGDRAVLNDIFDHRLVIPAGHGDFTVKQLRAEAQKRERRAFSMVRRKFTTMYAPWTDEEVDALNAYQRAGVTHEYTCGGSNHPDGKDKTLLATRDGWRCTNCEYTQNWASKNSL